MEGQPTIMAGCVIPDQEGRLLVLHRKIDKNRQHEWELPGGRLEAGEDPVPCLKRELEEELGIEAEIGDLLDCWRYPVLPIRAVLIVTFGVLPMAERELRLSDEHKELGLFAPAEVGGLNMPEGYRRSIRDWVSRLG